MRILKSVKRSGEVDSRVEAALVVDARHISDLLSRACVEENGREKRAVAGERG